MSTDRYFQCSAIHEAAHVVSALHWNVPVGRRGVSLCAGRHGGATGFAHMRWNAMAKTKPMTHAYRICTLIAPFAEFQFIASSGETGNFESRMRDFTDQSRADFGQVLGLERAKLLDCRTRATKTALLYGRVCLMLRAQREPDAWARAVSPETVQMTRELVSDADTMLRAYGEQVAEFADVLLSAHEHRLSPRDVNTWRDAHFQRCDVTLSARATRV